MHTNDFHHLPSPSKHGSLILESQIEIQNEKNIQFVIFLIFGYWLNDCFIVLLSIYFSIQFFLYNSTNCCNMKTGQFLHNFANTVFYVFLFFVPFLCSQLKFLLFYRIMLLKHSNTNYFFNSFYCLLENKNKKNQHAYMIIVIILFYFISMSNEQNLIWKTV